MPDIEESIKSYAPEAVKLIRRAAEEAGSNEAQFRGNLQRLRVVERFGELVGVEYQPRDEYRLINGRADAVYNRFVIEYEPPGSLRPRNTSRTNQHAIDQVKQYMEELARVERHRAERLAGVATDGSYFIFVRFRNNVWHIDDPLPLAAHSTERFLRYLNALSTEKALTADNLVRDFGENQNVARLCVSLMYQSLSTTDNPKVKVIFDQWRQQFSEVCGYEEGSPRLDIIRLARDYGVREPNPNPFQLFFSIHSYYATFIKLLAVQVVHYYMAPGLGTALPQVANYPTDRLVTYLKDMERGGILKQLGVNNFLEGDFFGWYLEVWDEAMDRAVRRLVSELANYSLVTLDVDPEQTRDLLKKLYQNVMPKQLRHDLGEYYTPDWLAERLLNQLGFTSEGNPSLREKRLLDPACGSGTFLVMAINRVKEHCAELMLPETEVLERILANIVGFDLNPLAVISARTNYLLALGDLLKAPRSHDVNIPVYLCDSILTPSQAEDYVEVSDGQKQGRMMGAEERQYKFRTVVGDFAVPGSLVSAQYVDQLAGLVEDCVEAKYSVQEFRQRVFQTFPLTEGKDDADLDALDALYMRIKDLDERAINGIWARIIKNAFAPLFVGQFDYVAGNPPWVNWYNLPDHYRQSTAYLWGKYGLFPHKGLRARLGGAMDDISVLMTYASADNYLKSSGRLGFIVTQTVFKSEGGGRGFRRFKLGDEEPLRVLHVDDWSSLKPFAGAANRTSVCIIEKGGPTTYPVPYSYWRKKQKRARVSEDLPLERIVELVRHSQWNASPVNANDDTSPWLTGRRRAIAGVRKAIGKSIYQARYGVHTHANSIYWIQVLAQRPDGDLVVSNLGDIGRSKVETITATVEPELVFPLVRGENTRQWNAEPSIHIVLPHMPHRPSKGIPLEEAKTQWPKTYRFLHNFEGKLAGRSGYRQYFNPNVDPFYSVYNVGPYTFSPYKLVWREQASILTSCVVGPLDSRPVILDHKLMLVPFEEPTEPHYLCSMLASTIAQFIVKGYAVETATATHVLNYVRVPAFDPQDEIHKELVSLSMSAHDMIAEGDDAAIPDIERRIDELAAHLWGLTKTELKDVQESLEDLRT